MEGKVHCSYIYAWKLMYTCWLTYRGRYLSTTVRKISKLFAVYVAILISVLVFDTIVFILTISKTWHLFKEWRAITKHWKDSLTAVLICDGLLHHSHGINIWLWLAQESFTTGELAWNMKGMIYDPHLNSCVEILSVLSVASQLVCTGSLLFAKWNCTELVV